MADKPARHWVKGENGWQSHERWRCDSESDCVEILMPPVPSVDENGKPNPWQLQVVRIEESI